LRIETAVDQHAANPVILATRELTRAVDGLRIVDSISVDIHRADVLAIVGPSGAGKSSFLRLLNRLDEPTAGTVLLEGADYRQIPPRELRRHIGMVMQSAFLFPGTIADNLRYGPRQHGEDLSDASVAQLLEQVDLGGYAGRSVVNLSGGEAQRVSLARAVANSPSVLLLDEPTSALDAAAQGYVERLITSVVRANHLTCVVVTHDLAQAGRMADRVMLMRSGRVERIGPREQVLNAERAD
jgi:putative ABC transport system ATP-binding protein